MNESIRRTQDFYTQKPDAGIIQLEFGYYCLEAWKEQGYINDSTDLQELFEYERIAVAGLGNLGWVTAALNPGFEWKVIKDLGDHELVQDDAGRHVLYFKNKRSGFMPEYVEHPVKDMRTWEENVKWRLDPATASRYEGFDKHSKDVRVAQEEGYHVQQGCIGGYMYLRSLIGPEDVLYKFYDEPELIHDCMKTWLELADSVAARHQKEVSIDELYFGEDICYNHGSLISIDMIREFLFPYYRQLLDNVKKRQLDKARHLYFQVDTDGFSDQVIPVYRELGMDYLSPFEVASNCDVVRTGREYPCAEIC